ncbi:methylated-DNA--[protein]-cysteine S-methyltransferase [Aminipila sp.]|uniref:methylated-DNA--[protein]-cysteine S-methyltransferase n=1 Tax=Aminipila sp. TaxID=2060095 RepID=UPI002F405B96
MMKYIYYYDTVLGKIGIAEENGQITNLIFESEKINANIILQETKILKIAFRQLEEYLQGSREVFELQLNPSGTEFQKKDWLALQQIPYGKTVSYGDIAKQIGCPKGARAVGLANNKNPIPIFIPCHRVIGASGNLVGYGGGIDKKIKLLEIEGIKINRR